MNRNYQCSTCKKKQIYNVSLVMYFVFCCCYFFFSFLNSCLDVNWTVCLDLGRWMLWLLFYVNVSVMAKWNETRKKREKTEPSFSSRFLFIWEYCPFTSNSKSFGRRMKISHTLRACMHAFVWVYIFAVYWRRTLYLLCTSFEDCNLSTLCFHTSFGNLIYLCDSCKAVSFNMHI